jgi:hypothetical protein
MGVGSGWGRINLFENKEFRIAFGPQEGDVDNLGLKKKIKNFIALEIIYTSAAI